MLSISVELTEVAAGADEEGADEEGAAAAGAAAAVACWRSISRAPAAMRLGAATRIVSASIILTWVSCGRALVAVPERSPRDIGVAEKPYAWARSPARRTLRSMLSLVWGSSSFGVRDPAIG
jgi:hypothetical protein